MVLKKVIIEVTVENPHDYGFLQEKGERKFLGTEMSATRYWPDEAPLAEQKLRDFLGSGRPCKIRILDDPYEGLSTLASLAAACLG